MSHKGRGSQTGKRAHGPQVKYTSRSISHVSPGQCFRTLRLSGAGMKDPLVMSARDQAGEWEAEPHTEMEGHTLLSSNTGSNRKNGPRTPVSHPHTVTEGQSWESIWVHLSQTSRRFLFTWWGLSRLRGCFCQA